MGGFAVAKKSETRNETSACFQTPYKEAIPLHTALARTHTHTRIRGERRVTKRYEKCLPPPLLPFSIQEGGDGYLLPSFRCAKVEQTLLARTHRESDALFASIRTDDDAYFPSPFFRGGICGLPLTASRRRSILNLVSGEGANSPNE